MTILENNPLLWRDKLPVHDGRGHKYDRGIAVIYGAKEMTGATRLAARACARMGAGLVKVIAPEGTGVIYRSTLHEEIVVEDEAYHDYPVRGGDGSTYASNHAPLLDPRVRAVLIGPGCGPSDAFLNLFYRAMDAAHIHGLVMDAGAFLSFGGERMLDLQAFSDAEKVVVTPHEGEFERFFSSADCWPDVLSRPTKTGKVEAAAKIDCTIVLKGAETVVGGLGAMIVQRWPVPGLATAGTGDVLAGMITGLLAQGMETKWAAAAAIWIHAEAAARFGKGLVASDLPEMIPAVLKDL